MEASSLASKQMDEADFNLKDWALRARRISRENTNISRRFSASNLKSFREEARSFTSNVVVSSTASSPGYTLKEEIDPSTYSFTTALKALQAKTVYTWEFQSPDGLTLNSKWNEAEKYICNPLSGEVPLECLSAKTLSGRSFRGLTSRITMSAPLIYPSQTNPFHANPPINEHEPEITSKEKKRGKTRDVGTQSTPVDLSSSSPSPAERSMKMFSEEEGGDSSMSSGKFKVEEEEEQTREGESRKRNGGERKKQQMISRRSSNSQGGCISLRGLWMRTLKHRDKHKPRTNNTNMLSTLLHHLNGCSKY